MRDILANPSSQNVTLALEKIGKFCPAAIAGCGIVKCPFLSRVDTPMGCFVNNELEVPVEITDDWLARALVLFAIMLGKWNALSGHRKRKLSRP